jgi:hypothetical protein
VDFNASRWLAAQHDLLHRRHYYEDDGNVPRCPQKCIVFGTVCVCELIFDHSGPCERVQTMRMATASDYATMKQFKNFVD